MSTGKQLEVVKFAGDGRAVIILDQTRLPNHEDYLTLTNEKQMWDAIKLLQVRGAPAIGSLPAMRWRHWHRIAMQHRMMPSRKSLLPRQII
jgi:methylthioribose-1-phosphate isomerase